MSSSAIRRVQGAICSERKRAIRYGSRAGAWRRNERRRLPLRETTTAAGSERGLQRAKASNQIRIARRCMEEERAEASSFARDDDGGGFRARIRSERSERSDTERAVK